MSTSTDNDSVAAVQAGIQEVRAEIDRIDTIVDRIDVADRFALHNQLDALRQRNAALSREVQQLQAVTDADGKIAIRNRVHKEQAELQRAVAQVAARVATRGADSP